MISVSFHQSESAGDEELVVVVVVLLLLAAGSGGGSGVSVVGFRCGVGGIWRGGVLGGGGGEQVGEQVGERGVEVALLEVGRWGAGSLGLWLIGLVGSVLSNGFRRSSSKTGFRASRSRFWKWLATMVLGLPSPARRSVVSAGG